MLCLQCCSLSFHGVETSKAHSVRLCVCVCECLYACVCIEVEMSLGFNPMCSRKSSERQECSELAAFSSSGRSGCITAVLSVGGSIVSTNTAAQRGFTVKGNDRHDTTPPLEKNNLLLKTTVVQHLYLYTPSATRGRTFFFFFFTTAALQVRTHSEDKDKQTTGVRLNAGPVPSIFSCYKHLMFCREHKAGVWIQLVVSSFKGRVCPPKLKTSHFIIRR